MRKTFLGLSLFALTALVRVTGAVQLHRLSSALHVRARRIHRLLHPAPVTSTSKWQRIGRAYRPVTRVPRRILGIQFGWRAEAADHYVLQLDRPIDPLRVTFR